ncbi:F-box/LRR-repeat protein 5-like [Hydractinia symbiolongicarpus]|uniref:F-box/LRR-repeat protein 5-like n=1 Tax=Hydractinia symbiolongicarpus TaxID=13093 RepID=UPI0025505200|nr:F-box/LRR-repeat protein 5-like [Hydractinia symbiolongicarpus]
MAAVEGKQKSYEDVDLFTIPHNRMKHILHRASDKVKCTDFSCVASFRTLLSELLKTFTELKHHEEIENKYIMKILKRRLQGEALKKLLVHLHAHSHISDILNQVRKTEREVEEGFVRDLRVQGLKLNEALQEFFEEYLPHMVEEEQVLQPMLMQFLPPDELRHIKEIVIRLHELKDLKEKRLVAEQSFNCSFGCLSISEETISHDFQHDTEQARQLIKCLPPEMLMNIFSYLNPKDLCHTAQVCKQWSECAMNGDLWSVLHPARWARGDWCFGIGANSDDCNCDCQPNYDLVTFSDFADEKIGDNSCENDDSSSSSSSTDGEESVHELVKKEKRILNGLSRYLLPKNGRYVKTFVLECSKAITNGMIFRILSHCRNLEHLDISQTIISDLGLLGLFKAGCTKLQYLDVSGCKNVTDKTLIKLSIALGKSKKEGFYRQKDCCKKVYKNTSSEIRRLHTLRLSGCYQITDAGLRALSKYGGLPKLRHLDLSGCLNVSADGLSELIDQCPSIESSELFYCDNIEGPYADVAAGCQNGGCLNRFCCRSLQD